MNLEKWENEYIKNIDIEKIEWVNLNKEELGEFFDQNYLDKDVWQYVRDKNANKLYPTLLGMTYLNLNNPLDSQEYNYLLGVVNNNILKKTILCATIYLNKYYLFTNQEYPVTYISIMEVNSYFRNMGIYKMMCKELINFINLEQHILTSTESIKGKKIGTFKILKDILINKGFNNYILENNYSIINSNLEELVCTKPKVLKK